MFDTKQLFKLGLFIDGTVFGMVGITVPKSRDAKCACTHATTAALRGKDCVMKTAPTLRENCDNIYEDAKDLNEHRYVADVERAYQEVKTLAKEHEVATEV